MSNRLSILILLALSAGVYVGSSAKPALLDDADASHALVSREMLQRGDWVVMYMNGIRYLMKSPLHYWLVAGSYEVLGESAFATRLPLALGVVGLVLMVYGFGRRFFDERAGFYAGLVICTSVGTFIFTRVMIPEAIFALEMTAAFYFFLRAWTGSLSPRAGYWTGAAITGLAVLTQGLIGVVFPVAIAVLYLLLAGGWRRWRELPILSSSLVFLAVAAPWHVIASLRAPGFFWSYFINEHFLRAVGTRYPPDYDAVPLFAWWAAHLVWFFPWSFFLPFALRELPRPSAWQKELAPPAQARLLLFVWAGFILFFFSLTSGSRMEYYSFGGWPAIALLLGLGLAHAEEQASRWLPRVQDLLAIAGVAAGAALIYALRVSANLRATGDISKLLESHPMAFYRLSMSHIFDLTPQSFSHLRVECVLTVLAIVFGLGNAWLLRRRRKQIASTLTLAITMAVFLLISNSAYQVFEPRLSSRPLAQVMLEYLRPDDRIVLYGDVNLGSSIPFYTRRKTWIYNGRAGSNLEFGSNFSDAPKIFLSDRDFPEFWRSQQRVFLFVPPELRGDALQRLPGESSYFLAEVGGKQIYVNQPIVPGQQNLAELPARPAGADATP